MTKDTQDKNYDSIRSWIQLTALIVTAVVSFWGFILKDILNPANEPAQLKVVAAIKDEGKKGKLRLIHTYIDTENKTNQRIFVPALWYTLVGYIIPDSILSQECKPDIAADTSIKNNLVCNFTLNNEGYILAQQRIVYDKDSWWNPKATTHDDYIIAIPDQFNFVTLYVNYLNTREIDDIDSIKWTSTNNCWTADYTLKNKLFFKKEKRVWGKDTFTGYNWYTTSLMLKK